jgi:DNA adenine methylase
MALTDSTLETQLSFLSNNDNHRPPLKWAGGKRWLVPHLKPLWVNHSHRRLVEPLCGGLAVTLGLQPKTALLNDVNEHLINFYKWLKRGLVVDFSMINSETEYYANRQRFNQLVREGQAKSEESAGLFYYLNRTGYNGLCRFNQSGEFNVPFGKYKTINYEKDFTAYKKTFSKWKFTNTSFDKVPLENGDFVYADPPYDVQFTQYSKDGFKWEDQVRLAELLVSHKGPVVLSNQATDRIINLYEKLGFKLTFLQAPRMISCTGDRTPAREVVALKGI